MGGLWATPLCTPGTACESQNLESLRRVGGLSFFGLRVTWGSGKTLLSVPCLNHQGFQLEVSVAAEVWF